MEKRQPVLERAIPPWDDTQLQILDAAEVLITQRGVGGLTIAELARTSGFSRPTVYRSWQGADDVVRATLLRRVLAMLSGFTPATTRDGLVADVLDFAGRFRTDAMYAALLDREPEVFTRYTLQRFGSSQRAILDWLAESIARAQEQGSVRSGEPAEIATMLLLITQSAILSYGTVSLLLDAAAWRRELRFALDGHLRP